MKNIQLLLYSSDKSNQKVTITYLDNGHLKSINVFCEKENFKNLIQEIEENVEKVIAENSIWETFSTVIDNTDGLIYKDGQLFSLDSQDNLVKIADNLLALLHRVSSKEKNIREIVAVKNFIVNLYKNPKKEIVEELYPWLQFVIENDDTNGFTITTTGELIGYKSVEHISDNKFISWHSGTATSDNIQYINSRVEQEIGSVVEMERNKVTFDPSIGCSAGLHIGTFSYASTFGENNKQIISVKVNPKDIVSVPYESNSQKIRACKYTVLEVVEKAYKDRIFAEEDSLD